MSNQVPNQVPNPGKTVLRIHFKPVGRRTPLLMAKGGYDIAHRGIAPHCV